MPTISMAADQGTECRHTFRYLLSQTDYAKDGPAVQRAMASTQMAQNLSSLSSQSSHQNLAVLPPSAPGPAQTAEHMQTPTDQGARLDTFRIFRSYGAYTVSHADVCKSLVYFLGDMTFGPDAVPSDALALASACSFMMLVADRTNVNQNIEKTTREKGTKAAHLSNLTDLQVETCCKALLDKETLEQFWTLYGILTKPSRDTSTMVTDALWQMCQYMACKLLQLPLPAVDAVCETATKDFMRYAAAVRSVHLSEGQSISLNTDGQLVFSGSAYKAVGYCREGIMLSLIREDVDRSIKSIALDQVLGYYLKEHETKFFFKTLKHHNMKSVRDSCGGCNCGTKAQSSDGRLLVYTNPLISSDLRRAAGFAVRKDGTVTFNAPVLMYDKPKMRVLRTGYRAHQCDLYDVHSLLGFDTTTCPKLSSLFSSDRPREIPAAESEGVCVQSTLERVDDYEVDGLGYITSITHGYSRKWAQMKGKVLKWVDSQEEGGDAFTLDDVVG